MAISQITPFLLLLLLGLVSLFFLPAQGRGVSFENCFLRDFVRPVIMVKSVDISDDSYAPVNRNGTFTLIGETSKAFKPEDVRVTLSQLLNDDLYIKSYSLCDVTACPVVRGPITLTFTDTFSAGPNTTKPETEDIRIIIDGNGSVPETFMCAEFRLWPNGHSGSFST